MPRFVVAVLFAVSLAAQSTSSSPSLEQRIDRMFRGCKRPGAPGAVVLVARGEETLLQKAYGLADLERGVPLTTDSVFDIGSTSKQFTAACVLLLERAGDLGLDDPVRRHVSELPAVCDPVTIRHLVLHTSGLPDYIGLLMKGGSLVEDSTTTDDAMAALGTIDALEFVPGSRWSYSNSNYLLLSVIVEGVAGVPLADFARECLFEPLGMRQTHVHQDCTALVPNRALSYSRSPRGGWRWHFSNWEQTGDGAVFTTVGDLLRWSRNFEHGKVGGSELLAAMAHPGRLDDGSAIDYGTGLVFGELEGERTISHGGAWAAYRADLLRIPARRITVVCLCNRDDLHPSERAHRIARLVLADGKGG